MTLKILRLGSSRGPSEGVRIGTVRFPPRGVPKSRYAAENWFDVWYPDLAPSKDLIRKEMSAPGPRHALDLLAALSHTADFSLGCYCEDESRCHRSVLRNLLLERGAKITRDSEN